jgi:hypothetical protein
MPKITVNKEAFLSVLQSVQAGLNQRENQVEQSSCVAFQDGVILTYNDEVSCRCSSGLPNSFKGAIQAKPLMEMLKKYPDETLELEATDIALTISGVRKKTEMRMEKEIVLSLDAVENPTDWKTLPEGFDEALETVSSCAGKEKELNRFDLSCIHFHPKYVEACDMVQLARYRIKIGVEKEFLVRKESIKHITNLGMTEFAETDSWVHFRNSKELIYSCRRFLEVFPSLDELIAVTGSPITLPGGLKEIADRAASASSERADDNHILLEIKDGKARITGKGLTITHKEWVMIKYSGPKLSFLVDPSILMKIASDYKEAEICTRDIGNGSKTSSLKVSGDRFSYVSMLMASDSEEVNVKVKKDPKSEEKEDE